MQIKQRIPDPKGLNTDAQTPEGQTKEALSDDTGSGGDLEIPGVP
jgi:hypothetical protein